MRELVLTALIACVCARPSIIAPYPYTLPVSNDVTSVSSAPTISPGDIEAVAIDAQVKLANQARILADESKDVAELLVENQNQMILNANDLAREKEEEALWAAEEKKWQALNQAQIAAARLAGLIASKVAQEVVSAEAKEETKSEATEMMSEEKTEIKSEIKNDEITSTKSEATEFKNEDLQMESTEAVMPANTMKENTVENKDVTRKTVELEEALKAIKSASQSLMTLMSGFHFQPRVAPIFYSPAYISQSFQHLPESRYQPALMVKNV